MDSNTSSVITLTSCPIHRFSNLFATASTPENKDSEHNLSIYEFDIKNINEPINLIASTKVTVPFLSFSWTKLGEDSEDHMYGYLVGGHMDGTISLWDVNAIVKNKVNKPNVGLIQTKKFHTNPIYSIKFNQKPNIFASGSKDIVLVSIDQKSLTMSVAFTCPSQDDSVITSLSWNDKVPHILAAATSSGTVFIWDMRKNTLYLTICDPILAGEDDHKREYINTKVNWCNDGVQLIIAYDHPEFNFLTQYDMRQPNAPSAEYHGGHSKPIYEICRNNVDTNFLLSLGRDNTVTCWSIRSAKPLLHMNNIQASQIAWLTRLPDYFLSVSLDGQINYHNVNFSNEINNFTENNEIPPKWLFKRSGVSFGFGGKFLTFSDKFNTNLNLHAISGEVDLADKMKNFIEKIEKPDLTEILDEKIANSTDKNNMLMWIALKYRYTKNDNELSHAMGFDKQKLQNEVYNYLGKKIQKEPKKRDILNQQKNINVARTFVEATGEALDFWSEISNKNESIKDKTPTLKENVPLEKPTFITEQISKNINWNQGAEKLIKQSLLIGDLESAVDVALKSGRDAEALLIASANPDLFNRTKQAFFNKNKDLFVKNIFSSIINNDFDALLEYNVLKDWKEYILYSKTYLSNDKFIQFAYSIADKLAASNEVSTAIICYILAESYDKSIELIYNNYVKETSKMSKKEKRYYIQTTFEIIIALKYILQKNSQSVNECFDNLVSEYCELLIDEGLYVQAYSYLVKIKNNNLNNLILMDRLYNHCEHKLAKQFSKIPTPFSIINVKPKQQKVVQQVKKNVTTVHNPTNDLFNNLPLSKKDQIDPFGSQTNITNRTNIPKQTPKQPINPPINTPVNTLPNKSEIVKPDIKPTPFKPVINPPKPNINKPVVEQQVVEESKTIQPPKPLVGQPKKIVQPPVPNIYNQTSTPVMQTPNIISQIPPKVQKVEQPMNQEEEYIYNSFENYINLYNSSITDENKQKDFSNKISTIFPKLKSHDLKTILIKLLIEFINAFDNNTNQNDLKKIYTKIQANGWDQNKNWMSCIEKIITLRK